MQYSRIFRTVLCLRLTLRAEVAAAVALPVALPGMPVGAGLLWPPADRGAPQGPYVLRNRSATSALSPDGTAFGTARELTDLEQEQAAREPRSAEALCGRAPGR